MLSWSPVASDIWGSFVVRGAMRNNDDAISCIFGPTLSKQCSSQKENCPFWEANQVEGRRASVPPISRAMVFRLVLCATPGGGSPEPPTRKQKRDILLILNPNANPLPHACMLPPTPPRLSAVEYHGRYPVHNTGDPASDQRHHGAAKQEHRLNMLFIRNPCFAWPAFGLQN